MMSRVGPPRYLTDCGGVPSAAKGGRRCAPIVVWPHVDMGDETAARRDRHMRPDHAIGTDCTSGPMSAPASTTALAWISGMTKPAFGDHGPSTARHQLPATLASPRNHHIDCAGRSWSGDIRPRRRARPVAEFCLVDGQEVHGAVAASLPNRLQTARRSVPCPRGSIPRASPDCQGNAPERTAH